MIYVVLKNGVERIWNIGGESLNIRADEINFIQADSDELDLIERSISGIPICNVRRVCWWFGDYARFIAANLRVIKMQ